MTIELLPGVSDIVNVPISSIVQLWEAEFPGANVLRDNRSLNKTHVRRLVESHGKWPALSLVHFRNNEMVTTNYQSPDLYAIVDGRHRYEASKKLRYNVVRATVGSYKSLNDVIQSALLANAQHGIDSSPGLRTAHALWMYDTYSGSSIEDIAQVAGIVPATLRSALKKRDNAGSDEAPDEDIETPPLDAFAINLHKSLEALRSTAERDGLLLDGNGDAQQVTNALRLLVGDLPIKERGYASNFIMTIEVILHNALIE